MKKAFTFLSISCFLVLSSATKIIAQATTKEITDNFFLLFQKTPDKAIEYAFSTNKWMEQKPEVVTQVKTQLKGLTDMLGDCYGYDLISDNSITENLREIKYLIRYDREPLRFTFLLYKPKDKWEVLNFSFNENMDKEIEEAEKTK